jgi:flagellar basal-body rod modification protein FlgD
MTTPVAPTPPVTPTPPVNGTSSTQSTVAGAQTSLVSDQQTFLKLLTTQLKNQDPLSPMNTDQFTQQLVSMTGVQQQIVSNQLLQQLVSNQSGMGDPVGLIGKTVTATTPNAALKGGQANWFYSLPSQAAKTQLQVHDSNGQLIWQSDVGSLPAGEHALAWNGKDMNGNQQPDGGTYSLTVKATDAAGAAISSNVYQRGLATSVEQDSGQTYVNINGVKILAGSVTSVGTTG